MGKHKPHTSGIRNKVPPEVMLDPSLSDKQVATIAGCSRAAISYWRKKLDLGRIKIIQSHTEDIIEMYQAGSTWQEIRLKYMAPLWLIPFILNSSGVRLPSASSPRKKEPPREDLVNRRVDYLAELIAEIERTAAILDVPVGSYRKWVDETPEGQWYFQYVQGLEGIEWEVDLERGSIRKIQARRRDEI